MPSDRALALVEQTPDDVPFTLLDEIARALSRAHGRALSNDERVTVEAFTGDRAAFLAVRVGNHEDAHDFEFFCADKDGALLDGALGLLVDYADGVLKEFFAHDRDAFLPLEFQARRFDGKELLVRSERRALALEDAADRLLAGAGFDDDDA